MTSYPQTLTVKKLIKMDFLFVVSRTKKQNEKLSGAG
jgi:hypothetical protein